MANSFHLGVLIHLSFQFFSIFGVSTDQSISLQIFTVTLRMYIDPDPSWKTAPSLNDLLDSYEFSTQIQQLSIGVVALMAPKSRYSIPVMPRVDHGLPWGTINQSMANLVFGPVLNIQYPTLSERSVLLQIEQTQRLYGSNERVYPGPLAASEASA